MMRKRNYKILKLIMPFDNGFKRWKNLYEFEEFLIFSITFIYEIKKIFLSLLFLSFYFFRLS
uniref:Uncharacterized protein n=1 Tax=Parascaris equorum TaxID=6256 RepID=A0A914S2C3_PAREQ